MSAEKLVEHFSALEDPRCAGKVDHRLIDILVIAVCAVIACAESWVVFAFFGRFLLGWLFCRWFSVFACSSFSGGSSWKYFQGRGSSGATHDMGWRDLTV